ncbi:MAG: HAMP domain-containing histidine kinase [Calditrichaceae bacterium]|nr:HAMP domain-containing histidine kinase [Calditrichaceae bacterium]
MMKNIITKIFNAAIKTRIIVIFSLIALILVGSMAFISYLFVRNIYLEQIEDQIVMMNNVLANDLNQSYLDYIQSDSDNMASLYYQKKLSEANTIMDLNNVFLFNSDFEILVKAKNEISPARLRINQNEIENLKISGNVASLPFKADDGNWYVWGFHRLTDRYYLGVQEGADRLERLDSLSLIFLGIAIFGLLLTFIAAWLVARAIAMPINQLVKFSDEIGHGNYQSGPPADITGELAILNNALVNMRDGILQHQEEKEKLLAEIAHEIRNPLGGVELLAGLIKENLTGESQNTEYADKIIKEIQGLKQQVNDFLQFSRSAPARPVSLNLNDIIVEIQNLYKKQLELKNISLVWENNLSDLKFDLIHMRQILMNLISNSINVLPDNGNIWIYANRNGKHSYISVSDNGPGISENDIKNIFEPFYSKRTGGTGLGLAICRKLCEENSARIKAENNKEAGCTFSIII